MTKILFLLAFLSFSGIALAQTEPATRPISSSTNGSGKKLGISSASRKSSLPVAVGPKVDGDGAAKPAKGDGASISNRPDGRVPKHRPGGPITRPSSAPAGQPIRLPGNRPSGPKQRPGGG